MAKTHLFSATIYDSGVKADLGLWANIKGVLEQEYTLWAAFLGSTFVTLATHGTDQDMVQRMLTAKNKRQSAVATILSGVADIPIQFAVLSIGILLAVYYGQNPDPLLPRGDTGAIVSNKAFPHFILTAMPGGLRGLVLAGVLATTMGSLSTALNALATSYTRDFHFRWFGEPATEAGRVRGLRVGTVIFAVLFVGVALATAWVSAMNPKLRIIPIILGIFGYTYGSLLGVFMVGLFTRGRGNDRGNVLAMLISFLFVVILSGLHNDVWQLLHPHAWVVAKWAPVWIVGGIEPALYVPIIQRDVLWLPEWLPTIEFPWRVLFGTVASFAVAVCFRTPAEQIENTRARNAESGEPHES